MLPRVILMRVHSGNMGTFGVIKGPEGFHCYSLELPWRDNKRSISCVPRGVYVVNWTWSPRFKRMMYLLEGVENRSGIREHSANLAGDVSAGYRSQLNGCIAPGLEIGWLAGQRAIMNSGLALVKYENALNRESHELVIDGIVG